jgi:hypothetical protein
MRRSAAPSVVWKKKKLADGSAQGLDSDGSPLAQSGEKQNHLDIYKEKENVSVEEPTAEDDMHAGRRTRQEAKVIKKNFALNSPNSIPICFAVKFTNLNRTAKKNLQGDGMYTPV